MATMQAAKAAQMRGKLPGELSAMVESATRASVDWRSVLHRFAFEQTRSDYGWALPNRRYTHMGLYLPALHDQSVSDTVFVRDTSAVRCSTRDAAAVRGGDRERSSPSCSRGACSCWTATLA
ncbi:DUF2201 family putative metallopeptidase [Cupriavidus basilensis]